MPIVDLDLDSPFASRHPRRKRENWESPGADRAKPYHRNSVAKFIEVPNPDQNRRAKVPLKSSTASKPTSPTSKSGIPSATFYSKRSNEIQVKPLPVERKRRVSAQKAAQSITKTLEDQLYDFDGDNGEIPPKKRRTSTRQKKTESPVKWPMLILPKRERNAVNQPKRLFTHAEDNDATDIGFHNESANKPSNVSLNETSMLLTSPSFQSEIKQNPAAQKNRIFDNMNKINEKVQKRDNVSFSYRLFSGAGFRKKSDESKESPKPVIDSTTILEVKAKWKVGRFGISIDLVSIYLVLGCETFQH